MANTLIVGSGFSAALVYSYINNSNIRVISPTINLIPPLHLGLQRINTFRYNKLFSIKSSSYSSLLSNLPSGIKLHNRLINGGNSAVWGGFYDIDVNFESAASLKKIGAHLKKLSYKNTGSISNKDSIHQLCSSNGNIYNSNKYLIDKIDNFYLLKFTLKKNKVETVEYNPLTRETVINCYDKVYICCGVVNTIAILEQSFNFNQFILDEYDHSISLCNIKSRLDNSNGDLKIRYTMTRALNHMLGIQKKFSFFDAMTLPLGVEQNFINNLTSLKISTINNFLETSSNIIKFGSSIHYNNLRTNNLMLDQISSEVGNRIKFFGMAAVKQLKPGPISNDIHQSIHNYFTGN